MVVGPALVQHTAAGSPQQPIICSMSDFPGTIPQFARWCVPARCTACIVQTRWNTGMVWTRRACEGRTELAFAMTLRLRFGFRGITTRAPFRCVDGTEFRKIRVCCAVTDYANALRAATTSTSPQPSCNTRALLRAGSRHNQCIVNPHAAEDSTRSLTMQQTVLARPATSKGPYPHLIEWWHALQP